MWVAAVLLAILVVLAVWFVLLVRYRRRRAPWRAGPVLRFPTPSWDPWQGEPVVVSDRVRVGEVYRYRDPGSGRWTTIIHPEDWARVQRD